MGGGGATRKRKREKVLSVYKSEYTLINTFLDLEKVGFLTPSQNHIKSSKLFFTIKTYMELQNLRDILAQGHSPLTLSRWVCGGTEGFQQTRGLLNSSLPPLPPGNDTAQYLDSNSVNVLGLHLFPLLLILLSPTPSFSCCYSTVWSYVTQILITLPWINMVNINEVVHFVSKF